MGIVVAIERARRERRARFAAAARLAPLHPALRWTPPGGTMAHRRAPGGGTACDLPGPLTLTTPDTARCPACWPDRAAPAPQAL